MSDMTSISPAAAALRAKCRSALAATDPQPTNVLQTREVINLVCEDVDVRIVQQLGDYYGGLTGTARGDIAFALHRERRAVKTAEPSSEVSAIRVRYAPEEPWTEGASQAARDVGTLIAALDRLTAAWSQHFDDTAAYAGGFTEPERAGIRAAARMMRDPNVQAQVAKTVGGES